MVGVGFAAPANAGVASPNWCLAGTQTGDSTEIYVDINACTDYVPSVKAKLLNDGFKGHFRFTGPRGYHYDSPTQLWPAGVWTPLYPGPGQTYTNDLLCEQF